MPDRKQIVLIGCPIFVVKPNPHKDQPEIMSTIESITFISLVIALFMLIFDAFCPSWSEPFFY